MSNTRAGNCHILQLHPTFQNESHFMFESFIELDRNVPLIQNSIHRMVISSHAIKVCGDISNVTIKF